MVHLTRLWGLSLTLRSTVRRLALCCVTGVLALTIVTRPGEAAFPLILGAAEGDPLVELVRQEARRAQHDLTRLLGRAAPDTTRIILCRTADEFARFAGRGGVELLGVAHPSHGLIALQMSVLTPAPERSLVGTLRHELAHLAMGGAVAEGGVFVPRWFDEGVASWFGGRYSELGPIAAERLVRAPWLGLEALEVTFPANRERRRLAYAKSLRAVSLLEETAPGTVRRVVESTAEGVDFTSGLELASGLTVTLLDERTRATTRWASLRDQILRTIASPYTLMALLVIFGFMLRRWRYRRRLAQWEQEEREPW